MRHHMRLFGDPSGWLPDDDVVALTPPPDPGLVVEAYREGVFPMPVTHGGRELMAWYAPVDRGILPLDTLRISKSLRASMKRYWLTVDTDFAGVLDGCADRRRPHGWIDDRVRDIYTELFERGLVHSVEARDAEGRLVGGLYGVALGGLFAGESMFHDPVRGRDASKVALVGLVQVLRRDGLPRLLDVQWRTDHLASLGAVEVSRTEYLARLAVALELPPPQWPERIDPSR